MIVTIPIAFVSPSDGQIRPEPIIGLFYGAVAGIIIIILYSAFKERKERQKERTKRRSKK